MSTSLPCAVRLARLLSHSQTNRGVSAKKCGVHLHQAGVQLELASADCPPRRGVSNSKPSSRVRCHGVRSISLAKKRTREIRSRAEPLANKFSPARMLLFGLKARLHPVLSALQKAWAQGAACAHAAGTDRAWDPDAARIAARARAAGAHRFRRDVAERGASARSQQGAQVH